MELPEASAEVARRLNISYGIEASNPQVVYETLGTGEHLLEAARKLEENRVVSPATNLDHLHKRIEKTRKTKEIFVVPTSFRTAREQIDRIAEELTGLENEFAEVCHGRDSLLKLAIDASEKTLTSAEITDLENLSDAELSRLFDERDMAELLRNCRQQLTKLEADPILSKLPALSENTQVICTGLGVLRKKLAALKAGEDFAVEDPPIESPSLPDVDVAGLSCRLAELERVVGIGAASRLKYSFADLPTALCQVTHQLMLLDPKRVDAIHERTSALAEEHDRLAGVLSGYGEFEKKIELLYANMSKWLSLSRSLPRIIRKLECCANLSREVSTIDGRINTIESQMSAIESLLQTSNAQLQELTDVCTKYIQALGLIAGDDVVTF